MVDRNYDKAKGILKNRFENPTVIRRYCSSVNHHRAMCPTQFRTEVKRENSLKNSTPVDKSTPTPKVLPPKDSTIPEIQPVQQETITSETILKGESGVTLLLVTKVDVKNPQHLAEKRIAALSDMRNEKSFITEKVARNIKLTPILTRTLSLYTFGKSKPELISSAVYKIQVKRKREAKLLQINSIPSFTSSLKKRNNEGEKSPNE